jgi:hypothetical protein
MSLQNQTCNLQNPDLDDHVQMPFKAHGRSRTHFRTSERSTGHFRRSAGHSSIRSKPDLERSSGVRGGIPPLLAPPPFKAGVKSEAAKAEFKLPIYRELVLPNRGGSRIYANF